MIDIQPVGTFSKPRPPIAPTPRYGPKDEKVQPDAAASNTAKPGSLRWDDDDVQEDAAAQNVAKNGSLQEGATTEQVRAGEVEKEADIETEEASTDPEPVDEEINSLPVEADTPPSIETEEFTVSVDEIRNRLRDAGIEKSKDTVQRWCRDGKLVCDKLGLFQRFYATEESVSAWIEFLQKDAAASNNLPQHAAARSPKKPEVQVHAGAEKRDTAENHDTHAAASNSMKDDAAEHIKNNSPNLEENNKVKISESPQSVEIKSTEDVEKGTAPPANSQVIDLLQKQIGTLMDERDFLREELVDRRNQAAALQNVIQGMKKQSEANLLQAQMQAEAQAKQSDQEGARASYTAKVVPNGSKETGEGDNPSTVA